MPRKKVNERRKKEGDIYRVESFPQETFTEFKKRQRDIKRALG